MSVRVIRDRCERIAGPAMSAMPGKIANSGESETDRAVSIHEPPNHPTYRFLPSTARRPGSGQYAPTRVRTTIRRTARAERPVCISGPHQRSRPRAFGILSSTTATTPQLRRSPHSARARRWRLPTCVNVTPPAACLDQPLPIRAADRPARRCRHRRSGVGAEV
jgi:hypothetical protein